MAEVSIFFPKYQIKLISNCLHWEHSVWFHTTFRPFKFLSKCYTGVRSMYGVIRVISYVTLILFEICYPMRGKIRLHIRQRGWPIFKMSDIFYENQCSVLTRNSDFVSLRFTRTHTLRVCSCDTENLSFYIVLGLLLFIVTIIGILIVLCILKREKVLLCMENSRKGRWPSQYL